jgi:arginyl-tRNA synthetase
LFDVYVNINKDAESDPGVKAAAAAWFKRMEDGDEDSLKNWRVWRELSVKKYAEEYERLNVHFDVYTGESKVGREWQDFALEKLDQMGLISDVEGAKLVDLEKWKLGKAVLRKKGAFVPFVVSPVSHPCLDDSDGTSIYLTRDIGGAVERYEQHKFDKMLYVISSQQDLHTAQFIKMLHLLEFPWASTIEHVNYGLVLGMSTRKGNVVFLEQIIREAASVMHEQMKKNQEKYAAVEDPEQTSLEVGLAAIKIQDMAAKRCATSSLSLLSH